MDTPEESERGARRSMDDEPLQGVVSRQDAAWKEEQLQGGAEIFHRSE